MVLEDGNKGAFVIAERCGPQVKLVRDKSRPIELPPGVALSELLEDVLEINRRIGENTPLDKVLDSVLEVVVDLTRAQRACIVLLDDHGQPTVAAARPAPSGGGAEVSQSIVGEVLRTGRAVLTYDAAEDVRFEHADSVHSYRLRSVLCVPLAVDGLVIGCIYIDNRKMPGLFRTADIVLLEAFADQAAIAINNARLLALNRELMARLQRQLDERTEELEATRLQLDQQEQVRRLRYHYDNIVHRSAPMRRILQIIDRVIDSDLPVLIVGESGTGKELLARAIHYNGPRKRRPFVAVNCGAIATSVFESEFFGHVKGAFTGADRSRKGYFEVAHGGTLFLDEVAELDLAMQVKLLRVLQEGEVMPVGSSHRIRVDVRIVAATNKDVEKLVEEGKFRDDLFYRLGVVHIDVPPLRERREDIPALVDYFVREIAQRRGTPPMQVPPALMEQLVAHDWPGNIRELENVVNYLSIFAETDLSTVELPFLRRRGGAADTRGGGIEQAGDVLVVRVGTPLAEVERKLVLRTLEHVGGSKSRAAQLLGIDRVTLYRKLRQYGRDTASGGGRTS